MTTFPCMQYNLTSRVLIVLQVDQSKEESTQTEHDYHFCHIQGKDPQAGPRNVLELMKEFHSSTVNGEKSASEEENTEAKDNEQSSTTHQASESSPSSTISEKKTLVR